MGGSLWNISQSPTLSKLLCSGAGKEVSYEGGGRWSMVISVGSTIPLGIGTTGWTPYIQHRCHSVHVNALSTISPGE